MSEKIIFDYFYGTESEKYSFYRMPKVLFTEKYFQKEVRTFSWTS